MQLVAAISQNQAANLADTASNSRLSINHYGALVLRKAAQYGLAIFLATTVFVPLHSAGGQTRDEYQRGVFSTPFTYDPSPIRLQIGNDTYDFPKNALFAAPSRETRQRAVLLRVLYPGMEGRTPANAAQLNSAKPDSRHVQILIEDFSRSSQPKTGQMAVNSAYFAWVSIFARTGKSEIIEREDPQLGLLKITVTVLSSGQTHDVIVDPAEKREELSFVIQCARIERVPNPQCSLYFAYRNVLIKASFARPLLSEWPDIRKAVVTWMDKHRISVDPKESAR